MLYLDSSVLVKRYVQEAGSSLINSRFECGEVIYTSMLTFAEVHSALGRMYRDKQLSENEKKKLVNEFTNDWLFSLTVLDVSTSTMTALPRLCELYSLKASNAVQLSAALWLKNNNRLRAKSPGAGLGTLEFGVSDRQLAEAALRSGFKIFNPA